jgi:hypothetical protein
MDTRPRNGANGEASSNAHGSVFTEDSNNAEQDPKRMKPFVNKVMLKSEFGSNIAQVTSNLEDHNNFLQAT